MARKTIKALVDENIAELRKLNHGELYAWAKTHSLDSASGFGRFKKALLEHDINYEVMRDEARAEKKAEQAEGITHEIVLYSDAKPDRYSITDSKGKELWYGRIFDGPLEQSDAELDAASKAVWLAGKIADANNVDRKNVRLVLNVDAEWLTWANEVGKGGKAQRLAAAAARQRILLQVEWVPGAENPADHATNIRGFMKWQESESRFTELLETR